MLDQLPFKYSETPSKVLLELTYSREMTMETFHMVRKDNNRFTVSHRDWLLVGGKHDDIHKSYYGNVPVKVLENEDDPKTVGKEFFILLASSNIGKIYGNRFWVITSGKEHSFGRTLKVDIKNI